MVLYMYIYTYLLGKELVVDAQPECHLEAVPLAHDLGVAGRSGDVHLATGTARTGGEGHYQYGRRHSLKEGGGALAALTLLYFIHKINATLSTLTVHCLPSATCPCTHMYIYRGKQYS